MLKRLHASLTRGAEYAYDFLNDPRLKKTIDIGKSIADAVSPVMSEPANKRSIFLYGKSAFQLAEVGINNLRPKDSEYLKGYVTIWEKTFSEIIFRRVLRQMTPKIRNLRGEAKKIFVYELRPGLDVRLLVNVLNEPQCPIHAPEDEVEQAGEILSHMLWDAFKSTQNLVLRKNTVQTSQGDVEVIDVEADDAFHALPSVKATIYGQYLQRCMAANVHRSILFHGPPGTGKTTLARTITSDLKLRTLRFRIEDISDLNSTNLADCVKTFRPDAIIVDDFDRAKSQEDLLEALDNFKRQVKLVLTTANNPKLLDGALLRPGRLDEILCIKEIDEVVIKKVLGPYQDAFETVRHWPIAYIEEYRTRRTFLNDDEMSAVLEELKERVAAGNSLINRDYDTTDTDIILAMRGLSKVLKKQTNGKAPAHVVAEEFETVLDNEVTYDAGDPNEEVKQSLLAFDEALEKWEKR